MFSIILFLLIIYGLDEKHPLVIRVSPCVNEIYYYLFLCNFYHEQYRLILMFTFKSYTYYLFSEWLNLEYCSAVQLWTQFSISMILQNNSTIALCMYILYIYIYNAIVHSIYVYMQTRFLCASFCQVFENYFCKLW